jgi:hypothetical protein
MTQHQFITKTLEPYFQDPDNCGHDGKRCQYRTKDGKKCAVGQHIRDEAYSDTLEDNTASYILHPDRMDILTDEAIAQNLSISTWQCMQQIHDSIAQGWSRYTVLRNINRLSRLSGLDFQNLKDMVK